MGKDSEERAARPGAQPRSAGDGSAKAKVAAAAAAGGGFVLTVLMVSQFLMALDSSVMNVSIAQVANDLGTTVTGVQIAITMYTLVMASLMITGGKIGAIIGSRRAFALGCVIYGAGSLTTALSPTLPVLLFGWSFLEGVGAALIMPAIVALIAANFPAQGRSRAYGLIAAAAAIAIAVGPLIGGAVTTFASWRWVFAGEVVLVLIILFLARRIQQSPVTARARIDYPGVVLSIVGLAAFVLGILRAGTWGFVTPKSGAPQLLGVSLSLWLILGGLVVVYLFFVWELRVERKGSEPLVRPQMLGNRQLSGGLVMFLFMFMVQNGTFFVVPLFLSVVLELSALATGVRLIPLSISLLIAALAVPKFWPRASPRRVVRIGIVLMAAGVIALISGIDLSANAAVVAIPLTLLGLGIGALNSQLGAVTVSAVSTKESPEVGGLQNTATNLGASLGTALVGAVLIAGLSSAFIANVQASPDVPASVKQEASVKLDGAMPFISDAQLEAALTKAQVPQNQIDGIMQANREARVEALHLALAVAALIAIVSLFFTGLIPSRPVGPEAPPGVS